jgi:hypothetical protein
MLTEARDFFSADRMRMPALAPRFKAYAALPSRAARLVLCEPGSALLALRMGAWVVALSLLVKLLPLPRAMSLVAPRRVARDAPADAALVQDRLARLLDSVLAADFWVFTPTCWKRAPVLHRYLALSGIDTRVIFGVRREGSDALSGHAWLEADGEPILEKTPPEYKVTYSFPASRQ